MTTPLALSFATEDLTALTGFTGRIAVFVTPEGQLGAAGRKLNSLMRKTLARAVAASDFADLAEGAALVLPHPAGLAASAVVVVKLSRKADALLTRKAGGALSRAMGKGDMLVLASGLKHAGDLALGMSLRAYAFDDHKSKPAAVLGAVTLSVADPVAAEAALAASRALIEGTFLTRDLVNAPANVLTTTTFAERLKALEGIGLAVEVLDEADLARLGMRLLLAVGQGSDSPSHVVVMRWNGGGDEAPVALVGKGVVFDTGGISIKPAAGMENMTMDMGGAGAVVGAMTALALRGAKANVVGLVGLVENMPSGNATRPGDIVASMKGDTVEIINTDAEGRLVLADVLWYAQERFKPRAMVDLATLTGAMMVALGHENAGYFSNNDALAQQLQRAADAEGEGAWRMPLGAGYAAGLKSAKADLRNVGGREGGASIAAEFLRRFVKDETPWVHLDIAGTALANSDRDLAPKGATGWGVLTLNRLIADNYEG